MAPFAAIGIDILVHERPKRRGTFAEHFRKVYVLGTAVEHYR